jgi:hypothetical protein
MAGSGRVARSGILDRRSYAVKSVRYHEAPREFLEQGPAPSSGFSLAGSPRHAASTRKRREAKTDDAKAVLRDPLE